ncbi:hypothetical protein [Celeribacter sp.]|uniref:hypothetical protein n=1 Tax=Celeribacter sp. TaxID=1890673 RepID=UPI003A93C015
MRRPLALIIAGSGIGLFIGLSIGIAAGGTAYNGAVFLVPLGAFIGWLISTKSDQAEDLSNNSPSPISEQGGGGAERFGEGIGAVVSSALTIAATVWNFHIDLLQLLGLLPTFIKQPLLFLGLAIVATMLFPPFLVVYFFCWLGASHFGISEEGQYRAIIK